MERAVDPDEARGAPIDPVMESVVQLAMLRLNPGQREPLARDFARMVAFAGELAEVRREAPPAPALQQESDRHRPDTAGESLPVERVLMNAKTVEGRCITVPKTFD